MPARPAVAQSAAARASATDAPPIVLIHGFAGGPEVWASVAGALGQHRTVHVIALDGHRTGEPIDDYATMTSESFVDGVLRDLDRLGVDTAHLVGNSLGGWIALRVAARGRAASVTCFAPAGGWREGSVVERAIVAKFAAGYAISRGALRLVPSALQRPRVRAALMRTTVHRAQTIDAPTARVILENFARCPSLVPLLLRRHRRALPDVGTVDVPVRIAWSEFDRILRGERSRQRYVDLLPEAEHFVLPGVGHVPMLEDPSLVVETILEAVTIAELAVPAMTI